jgi:hypothetical protein
MIAFDPDPMDPVGAVKRRGIFFSCVTAGLEVDVEDADLAA